MRNTRRKRALSILGTLIEVLASSWCSRFSCIGIWKSVGTQKDCSIVPPTSWLYIWACQWAETGLHAHILSWFQRTHQAEDTEHPRILRPGPTWGEVAILGHSKVQQVNLVRKSSHFIAGMKTTGVCGCHCCTELLCNHRRERGSPRAQLISPKCRCQKQAGWIPTLSVCLTEGSTCTRGSDLMCTSYVFWSSEINHTASIREPCRPSRWTSPADLLRGLQVHASLLLGSESGCLDSSLNFRRTNLHRGRAVPWDSCNLRYEVPEAKKLKALKGRHRGEFSHTKKG